MGTKITKSNVKSAMKDDAAHIDYLKRDILDDQKGGGKYKDINQTADEEHISKLAGDIRHDHSFLSKHWTHSSPLNKVLSPPEFGKDVKRAQEIADLKETGDGMPKLDIRNKQDDYEEWRNKDKNDPLNFVDIAEGEVDGVAYGAADVDGHIAVDTSTVGYDDTVNLP
tara:strand:- start:71 stop:574 length:504 start_codon:yes stop_codon:yes gene_type:complete